MTYLSIVGDRTSDTSTGGEFLEEPRPTLTAVSDDDDDDDDNDADDDDDDCQPPFSFLFCANKKLCRQKICLRLAEVEGIGGDAPQSRGSLCSNSTQ